MIGELAKEYPDNIDAVRDELIADAVGLYAAFGYIDIELEKKFLGIRGTAYTGGRLENYTDEPDQCIEQVCRKLSDIKEIIDEAGSIDPFDIIPLLICL